ncbi:hypothetical protein P4123_13085 [Pseudomonas aeruginosa]|nr:hypothetical protein [Pseudomonas aeruginosa]
MPVLALRLTALAALAISVSGCVMEAYGSRARSDAQSWIGLPIQDVIKRFGEPERVTGDAARQKYVWKEYENYSHDYGLHLLRAGPWQYAQQLGPEPEDRHGQPERLLHLHLRVLCRRLGQGGRCDRAG